MGDRIVFAGIGATFGAALGALLWWLYGLGLSRNAGSKFTYTNSLDKPLLVVLEPWAEEHWLAPKATMEIVGEGGDTHAFFELEQLDDRLVIYAWPESIATVHMLD